MNVSEYIFDFLVKKGVDTSFIITGGQAMFLNDAIGKHVGIKKIFHHHEQACTMSADAYGRITNKPAVALVTAGPAAVNALNGVIGGYIDSSPMIVISGQSALSCVEYQHSTRIRQYGVQGIDIEPMVKNYVKYFKTIDNTKKIKYYLEKAYFEATSGRKGPVWIDVPLDMQKAQVNENDLDEFFPENEEIKPNLPSKIADLVYDKIKSASKPILLVGQGVKLSGATGLFHKLVDNLKIPVITARLGIDLMDSSDALYVGRPGNYGERAANFALQSSDLIIVVGCRLATALVGHDAEHFAPNAFKIVVDIDQKELEKPGVKIDYKIHGDCKDFITLLLEKPHKAKDFSNWTALCQEWKAKYPVVLDEYRLAKPINSYNFVDKLSDIATADSTILVDTGSCFHVASQCWKVKKGQNFLTTGGLSSMGYWCACIGASMAKPNKNIICITGDGSFQMNIQELATVKHNKLPIKIFILNNNGYLLIRHTQRNFFNSNFVGESPETGLWCPDALKIAKAYEIKGVRIDNIEDMDSKIREVLSSDGPVICEIMTATDQLLIPRVASEKLPDGTLVSRAYDDMFPYIPHEEYLSNLAKVNKI